jgi:hypothetical protein
MGKTQNNPIGGTFDKVDAIVDAYSQLRISGITRQPTPGDLELALNRLEGMAAEWATRNICSNWNFQDQPDPNEPSNVQLGYKQAYATNLAVRLAVDFGKQLSPGLIAQATQSLSNLSGRSAMDRINMVPYPSRQPRGSGNTLRYNRWNRFYRNQQFASNSCSTVEMFVGDVNDYTEHFDAYLNSGETISSVDFSADSGITINSSSFTDTDVNYQILAANPSESTRDIERQLVIIVTTSDSRVETRVVTFVISPRPRVS